VEYLHPLPPPPGSTLRLCLLCETMRGQPPLTTRHAPRVVVGMGDRASWDAGILHTTNVSPLAALAGSRAGMNDVVPPAPADAPARSLGPASARPTAPALASKSNEMGPSGGGRAGAGDDLSVDRRTEAAGSHRHHHQSAVVVVTADRHAVNERTLLLGSPFVEANPVVTGSGPTLSGVVDASGQREPGDVPAPPRSPIVSAGGGQPLALRRGGPGVNPSSTTAVAGETLRASTVHHFLEFVRTARSAADLADLGVDAVVSAILARTLPSTLMVKHGTGCVSTYVRNPGTRKRVVQRSQQNRRQAVLRRLGASGPTSSALAVHRTLSSRSPPLLLPAAETAGLLAAIGLSDTKYNRLWKGFGAGLSQMASLPQLRQARTLLLNSSAYEVSVEDSGAHRNQLRFAVEERLGRLCAANLFLERPLYDSSGKAIRKTRTYTTPATGGSTYPDGCPPADMLDAQISIGLDKGGSPSSVKVVVGLINQAAPNRLGNTLLLAVCPCEEEKYQDVAAMLRPHRAAV